MELSKTAKSYLKRMENGGYVQVHATDSFSWKRRELLSKMEENGLVKLNLPITGSYLTYHAVVPEAKVEPEEPKSSILKKVKAIFKR